MKSFTKVIYVFTLLLALVMLILIDVHENVDEINTRAEENYTILTDYEVTQYEDETAPAGVVQEYRWTLQDVPQHEGSLVIYLIHQEVEICIGGETVYSVKPGGNNYFSKAVGCGWAKIHVNKQDEGSWVRMTVKPLYKSSISNKPVIYFGSFEAICMDTIKSGVPLLVMGAIGILVGIAFILFVLINRNNPEIDRSVAMLGIFSIFGGLWKICDVPVTPLIFGHPQALSAIAITSISIMAVSYLFFVRKQFSSRNHKSWDIMCTWGCLSCLTVVVLQITGIADVRQTITLCHLTVLVMIAYIICMIIWEMRHTEILGKLKTTIFCCLIILLGTAIDLMAYYVSNESGSMIYGMMAFLTYVLMMGYYSLKETLFLINRGKKAQKYEQMAMHDELTGLYNRAYYATYLKNNDVQQHDCYVVTFDVNNLKICNDTFGHDCGDRLLQNCSKIMKQAFGDRGVCFRMGGDEFTVILRHSTREEVQEYLDRFQQRIEEFNETYPEEFPVHIAFGSVFYDAAKDYDFSDTMRRADKKMYQMKMIMKTTAAQEG